MSFTIDRITVNFDGDYGYELSAKQQEYVKQRLTPKKARLLTAYEIAANLCEYFGGDYVRIIEYTHRHIYRVCQRGYTMLTVYRDL